ncbi:MAG: bifunctional DNA primase/polymerase [Melioribacteraceae bacterium]|nr:bifunctional DNA primase/polymerase [Melioribacteraceae bacterium]
MNLLETAKDYHHQFGFNLIPFVNKMPKDGWKDWQEQEMSIQDIEKLNWNSDTSGLGAVCGIGDLRCFDFDDVAEDDVVKNFMLKLGLPHDYPWLVKTGSGKGFHLWFYCANAPSLFGELGGEKGCYVFKPKISHQFKQIELRWKKSLTILPPSKHASGNSYQFCNMNANIPETPPVVIGVEQIIKALNEFCIVEPKVKQEKPTNKSNRSFNKSHLGEASDFLRHKINNYDEFLRIGFALASLGEEGRSYFLRICKDNPNYPDESLASLNKKFDGFINGYSGEITLGTFYEIAKNYGFKPPQINFWTFNSKGVMIIEKAKFIEYLQDEGYGKLILGSSYIFVEVKNNIVKEVTPVSIKDHVFKGIEELSDESIKSSVKECLIRNVNFLFSKGVLECLATLELDFLKDRKEKAYFFFNNVVLEVSAEGIKIWRYEELKGCIWEKHIIQRDFEQSDIESTFQKFIENICKNDLSRIAALRSAIGYLLHAYKDPTRTKAIIFTDEKLSDSAYGRSGKGVVAKAINQLRVMIKFDGKNFNFDKSFAYQSVNLDTQIMFFDDVQKKFDFEKLFSVITEGITVEKKQRDEFRIPFEESPKPLITTNYSISGHNDSSKARQFVIEFSDYYNKKHTPVDDFGKKFFIEWNEEEWISFYNLMIECCRFYLEKGLVEYEYVNLQKKKLIDATSPEFEEFLPEIPLGVETDKKELFEKFKNQNEEVKFLTQHKFTRWLKIYADLYELSYSERKSGDTRLMILTKQVSKG